jgi:ferredoxin-NADP reductase
MATEMATDADLTLLVERASFETPDILVLDLVASDQGPLPPWRPGAHVDLVLKSGKIRQYSLCGDPADQARYRIAVLRERAGRGGSLELHASATTGITFAARGPRNHFDLVDAHEYLFLAGGIGVTPILPMIRAAKQAGRPWRLVYGGRSLATMGFVTELDERRGGEVKLVPQDELGLPDIDALLSETRAGAAIYACGPAGMLKEVELVANRYDLRGALHVERFSAPEEAPNPASDVGDQAFEVELRQSGLILHVAADRSLGSVLQDANVSVPFSCQEGYCGSCETRVIEGVPDHRDSVLNDEEKSKGQTMMVCVGRARSPRLVLDL